nr:tripartite tricarboxylate transporter permease [Marinicella sp. W31]MDC2879711.1 tripartite tricarboxylate transporter permease [Marinicella sp. W31]
MLKLRSLDLAVTTMLLAVGIAQFVGGYTMDRLEIRHIHPASIPGLLPMFLGVAITVVAAFQLHGLFRARHIEDESRPSGVIARGEVLRLTGLIALCAIYALFLVGRIHFWVASSLFVACFIMIFELHRDISRRQMMITIARAIIIAVVFGGALSFLLKTSFGTAAMTSVFDALISAFTSLSTPMMLFHVVWATLLGIFVGALPGLTATMGVALLTTLTYSLERDAAILVLICMYVGAIYGGSRSAILLNIPGTPASAATSLDGFPLVRQGKGTLAMAVATFGSMLGTLVGIVMLIAIAPPLAEAAFGFGSYEFFWLALFGIIISGQLTHSGEPLKGYMAGLIGLSVAMIGSEGIHSYVRFNFDIQQMNGGIDLIPAMVGAFGFAEVLFAMTLPAAQMVEKNRFLRRSANFFRPSGATSAPCLKAASSAHWSALFPVLVRISAPGVPMPPPSATQRSATSSARAARKA